MQCGREAAEANALRWMQAVDAGVMAATMMAAPSLRPASLESALRSALRLDGPGLCNPNQVSSYAMAMEQGTKIARRELLQCPCTYM